MTPAEVQRVAALARLEVSEAEAAALAGQLSGILDVIRGSLAGPRDAEARSGSDGGSPDLPASRSLSAPPGDDGPLSLPLRADLPGADPLAEPPAAWAPGWRDGFFTVPRLASHRGEGEAR